MSAPDHGNRGLERPCGDPALVEAPVWNDDRGTGVDEFFKFSFRDERVSYSPAGHGWPAASDDLQRDARKERSELHQEVKITVGLPLAEHANDTSSGYAAWMRGRKHRMWNEFALYSAVRKVFLS